MDNGSGDDFTKDFFLIDYFIHVITILFSMIRFVFHADCLRASILTLKKCF